MEAYVSIFSESFYVLDLWLGRNLNGLFGETPITGLCGCLKIGGGVVGCRKRIVISLI